MSSRCIRWRPPSGAVLLWASAAAAAAGDDIAEITSLAIYHVVVSYGVNDEIKMMTSRPETDESSREREKKRARMCVCVCVCVCVKEARRDLTCSTANHGLIIGARLSRSMLYIQLPTQAATAFRRHSSV